MKSCDVERRPWEEVKRPEIMDLLEEENLALLEWETAPPRGGRRCKLYNYYSTCTVI